LCVKAFVDFSTVVPLFLPRSSKNIQPLSFSEKEKMKTIEHWSEAINLWSEATFPWNEATDLASDQSALVTEQTWKW